MEGIVRAAALAALALFFVPEAWAAAPALPAKEEALWAALRRKVEGVEQRLDGVLGVSVKDFTTGATYELRPDEPFPQASVIKLAVLYELYRQAEEGKIDLGEVTRPPAARVDGGVIFRLGDRLSLTWRDLAVLMMGWSDNAATNILIERVGMDAVNRRLDLLGLPRTRLKRRMIDLEAARRGDENVSTPSEMRRLVEIVHAGQGLSPERARDMRAVAAVPKSSEFRKPLPESLTIMDKDGQLEGVRTAAAVVEVPGRPYSVTIMATYLRRDADGDAAIREISAALFETFDRLARSSDLGRIISER